MKDSGPSKYPSIYHKNVFKQTSLNFTSEYIRCTFGPVIFIPGTFGPVNFWKDDLSGVRNHFKLNNHVIEFNFWSRFEIRLDRKFIFEPLEMGPKVKLRKPLTRPKIIPQRICRLKINSVDQFMKSPFHLNSMKALSRNVATLWAYIVGLNRAIKDYVT